MPRCSGTALCWPHVYLTKPVYGPVQLALGRPIHRQEDWFVVSDEPTEFKTFAEYGRRFDLEARCFEDQSKGFQLESSLIRAAHALERLCGVLASTTLELVAPGTEVVTQGTRRWVEAHWLRGQRSLTIGWHGVQLALSKGYELITSFHLSSQADPVPAMASKIQHHNHPELFVALEFQEAVA